MACSPVLAAWPSSVVVLAQDPDSRAVINRLFGVEQHTSLRNEESGESIEVGRMPPRRCYHAPPALIVQMIAVKLLLLFRHLLVWRPLERNSVRSTLVLVESR